MNRKLAAACAVFILVPAVAVTAALATPARGLISTVLARGTLVEPVSADSDGVRLTTDETTDHTVQTITFPPGSSSGWHTHPGVVLVTVASGTLTRYNGHCMSEPVTAGQTFYESRRLSESPFTFRGRFVPAEEHPTLVRNEGTEPVVVYVTYILPTGAPLRIDLPNPGCAVD